MALSLLASLRRLAPQAQRRAVRQLGSASAGGEGERGIDLDEIRARRAAAAATDAAGGDGKPAAGADGEARRRARSRDGLRTRLERESEGSAALRRPAARDALAGPLSAEAKLEDPVARLTKLIREECLSWSAVLDHVDVAVRYPRTVLTALTRSTRLTANVAAIAALRADPRFLQLLCATEQFLPAYDADALMAVLRALVRLRVSSSDETLRRVLDACAAKRMEDFMTEKSKLALIRLHTASEELGWVLPPVLIVPPSSGTQSSPWAWATPEQQALNEAFFACTTPEAVLELAADNWATLHELNLASALLVCSRLVGNNSTAATTLKNDSRFMQLVTAMEPRMISMSPRILVTAWYSCAKLGVEISDDFRGRFFEASAPKLRWFDSRGLSSLLHACALLDAMPPKQWFQQFYAASSSKMSTFTPQGFSITFAACATLKNVPPASWLQSFWDASSPHLVDFQPQGFANVMHACGVLRVVPPDDWLQRYWDISGLRLNSFHPVDFSKVWNTCSWLAIQPSPDWLESFWMSSVASLDAESFDPFVLTTILHACGTLGVTPPDGWLQRFWHASEKRYSEFTPGNVSHALEACRQLGCEPPAHLIQRFFAESSSRLRDEFRPVDMVRVLLWCGHTDHMPPPTWLNRFLEVVTQRLGEIQPHHLCEIIFACKRAGIDVPEGWNQHYHDASLAGMTSYSNRELSFALRGFERSCMPSDEWLQAFWAATSSAFGKFTPQNLSVTLYACQQLQITPPDDWLQCFWSESLSKMHDFMPQTFSNVLYACMELHIRIPKDWFHAMWEHSAPLLGDFKPQELGNFMMACGELGILPPKQFLLQFWEASEGQMSRFCGQDFTQVLCGLGNLGIVPPTAWMAQFWRGMNSRMDACSPLHLSTTIRAAGQLQVVPPAEWLDSFLRRCVQMPVTEPNAAASRAMDQTAAAGTMLGLAWLGLWELPLWPTLWERAWRLLPSDAASWHSDDSTYARSLYHTYQAMALDRPGMLSAPSPELFDMAEKAWCDSEITRRRGNASSYAEVSACLTSMGIAHTHAQWCDRAKRLVMIAMEGEGGPIALEVNLGTALLQPDRRLRGSGILRSRIFAAHGWRVVDVDFGSWRHKLQAEREEHLRTLLR